MNENETRADRIRRIMAERPNYATRECAECWRVGGHESWCDKTK